MPYYPVKNYKIKYEQDWTLVYCEKCRQPFPITQFHALTRGEVGWRCPLCATIERFRERQPTDCSSGV